MSKKFNYNNIVFKKGFNNDNLIYGDWGLLSISFFYITENQIAASLNILKKYLKKQGEFKSRVFVNRSVSFKSTDSRMGSGKGDIKTKVSLIRKNKILFELLGVQKKKVFEIFHIISLKLPRPTKIIKFI